MKKGRSTLYDIAVDYSISSPMFSTKRMDEGPRANCLGRLLMLLHFLNVQSVNEVIMGSSVYPKYYDKLS